MTVTAERTARRYPAVLLGLAIIAAVFAMHGPSSDHTLLMPTPTSTATAHQTPTHATDHAHAVRADDRQATMSSGVAECGMGHADCLATLRHGATQPPSACGATMRAAAAFTDAQAAQMPVPRAPPGPLLEGLCISRT